MKRAIEEIIVRNKLKLARVERDLTQKQLADLVGVSRQTILFIEAGKYNPTLRLCLAISKVLEKGLDELFWFEGEKNEK